MCIDDYINQVSGYLSGYLPLSFIFGGQIDLLHVEDRNVEHVRKWIMQFDDSAQLPMLRELSHILKFSYISRERFKHYIKKIVESPQINGGDMISFWSHAILMDIQINGTSQKDILKEFNNILNNDYHIKNVDQSEENIQFVYFDDFLYTGNRIVRDIESWINAAPDRANINICTIGCYKYGLYKTQNRLDTIIQQSGKHIKYRIWKFKMFENTQKFIDNADLYYPSFYPTSPATQSMLASDKYPFQPRQAGGYSGEIFNNEYDRNILEEQLLKAGEKIIALSSSPSPSLRPLGIGGYGLGFGSTIVTYRNCPNNAPLAFWWGDSNAGANHPLSKWYPLFPRKPYAQF